MNQLIRLWNSLSMAQRISLIVAHCCGCRHCRHTRWKHDAEFPYALFVSRSRRCLNRNTENQGAGIEYKLDETGATVMVPADRSPKPVALAGSGMPHSGRIGFELFDRTNLGASDFTEQVNYQRALEGELERTVATLAEVEQARIHITRAKNRYFWIRGSRRKQPSTALARRFAIRERR